MAVADVFFALGDRTRFSVLTRLGSDALTATMLAKDAKVTRQAIAKHLQVLKDAGLVKHQKDGRNVLYCVNTGRLREAQRYLEMVSAGWDEAIERLRQRVEEPRG